MSGTSITSGAGWASRHRVANPGGVALTQRHIEMPVVVWLANESGVVGMVIDDNRPGEGLISAEEIAGFVGYVEVPRVVSAVPAKGWSVHDPGAPDDDVGERVVAWAVFGDGEARPVAVANDGTEISTGSGSRFEVRPRGGWPKLPPTHDTVVGVDGLERTVPRP